VSATAPSAQAREVARAAAQWLTLVESGEADAADLARLQQWREGSSSHEQAWQKAQLLRQRFAQLPSDLALASLDRPDPQRRQLLKRALVVSALVPGAWLLARQMPLEAWRADLHTGTGERRQLPLVDGSSLQLNTASAVDVDLAARRLTLIRGEMALKVPGTTPLFLDSRYGRLSISQAEVCLRLDADDCQVAVVSGVVQVQPLQGPAWPLEAGRQVRLRAAGAGVVQPFDSQQPGWREGVLLAQNQPLAEFLQELGRYRPGVLRWAPELEALRVTGSFRLDDTDRVLNLLAASLPLEVQARTRFWITLVPKKNIG
jgi:transmembrane sensor